MTDKVTPMNTRATDHGSVKVTREVPLHWILSVLGGLAVTAITIYVSFAGLAATVDRMSRAVEKLTAAQEQSNLSNATLQQRVSEHERRITALEAQATNDLIRQARNR